MSVREIDLRKAGLTANESTVYLRLLQESPIGASALAKKIGLDRSLTYQVLNTLVEKGLSNYIIKENKKFFSSSNPENLLNKTKEQEDYIKRIIPKLNSLEKGSKIDQEVHVYEGKAGLRALYREMYKFKDICFFGATGKSYEVLKYELPRIAKELEKNGLRGRGIADESMKDKEFTKLKYLKIRYIKDTKSYDTATTITNDGKIAIHCLAGERPLVIIIKNIFIADTYRNYFEILWGNSKL